MKIALSEIKGMERRVRKSQSPEKLDELADSLREMGGVIVPIKVRKNGSGYTLVYGHRRVAAAKMAGFKEIEAFIADVPEDRLLTQALVENVVREDMAAIDTAKALAQIIKETGCTQEALAKKLGWSPQMVARYLSLLEDEIRRAIEKSPRGDIPYRHVEAAKEAGDTRLAARVLEKAGKEDLSQRETRQVAEVVRKAAEFGGEKAVRRVLAQSAAQIIASAPVLPKSKKPQPKAYISDKIHFEWLKDPRLALAEDAIRTVSRVVSEMARGKEDRKGGKAALKIIRAALSNALNQVDRVLRDM
jgi:ParB family chromosome partitioning protein